MSQVLTSLTAPPVKTLLAATTITADATTTTTPVRDLRYYNRATVQLIVSAKTMDASTTLNIYLQRSIDEGTNWDDIGSFTQVTNSAVGNGTYFMELVAYAAGVVDRVKKDGSLTANSLANVATLGDWWRLKYVSVNFAGTDTITIAVTAQMHA